MFILFSAERVSLLWKFSQFFKTSRMNSLLTAIIFNLYNFYSLSMTFKALPTNFRIFHSQTTPTYSTMTRNYGDYLKTLSKTNICDWLLVNKLTRNAKESNFVIFKPYQRKLELTPNTKVFDITCNTNKFVSLGKKDHVKSLGLRRDNNWKLQGQQRHTSCSPLSPFPPLSHLFHCFLIVFFCIYLIV